MHQLLKFIFGMKLYMFRTIPLSMIRSFSLYTQQWLDYVNKTSLMQFVRYLLYPSQLYMFRMSIPSILRSTGMYRREGTIYVLK